MSGRVIPLAASVAASCSLLVVLSVLALTPGTAFAKGKECAACTKDYTCATGRCFKRKCVYGRNKASILRCFPRARKPECASCKRGNDCYTRVCLRSKCVRGSVKASARCFLRGECAYCRYGGQCAGGVCIQRRCTDGSRRSLKRCGIRRSPPPTPSVTPSPSPRPAPKKDCLPCKYNWQCISGRCTRGVCGKPWKVQQCRKKGAECYPCRKNADCIKYKCFNGICSNGKYGSLLRCGRFEACANCSSNSDCATNYCFKSKCVASKAFLRKCDRQR